MVLHLCSEPPAAGLFDGKCIEREPTNGAAVVVVVSIIVEFCCWLNDEDVLDDRRCR